MEVSTCPQGASSCPQQEWKRNSMSVKKRFEEDFKFEGLSIKQSPATEPPSCVYEAAIVLAKFIEKNYSSLQGKTVLELGAGCGFTSLFVAKKLRPSKVVTTDMGSVLELTNDNILLNQCTDKVQAKELFWGTNEHLSGLETTKFDLVLGSDLLYDFDYFTELVETLDKLYNQGRTEILFCYTHRFSDVQQWFLDEIQSKGFKYKFMQEESFDQDYCDPQNIFILKIFK